MNMAKIGIIGGGMAGLGAAYELSLAGHEVVLYERSNQLGGLAGSLAVNNVPIEQYYHHMFPSYNDMIPLANELGLGKDVFFKKASTAYFIGGRFFPFNGALDLLRFTPLPFIDRIRTGVVVLLLRLKRNWRSLEKIRASDWLLRYFGSNVYRTLWEPLISSKFGRYARDITMSWFWGRIYERPTSFGYFTGGFKRFVDALEQRLVRQGVSLVRGASVERIEKTERGFLVHAGSVQDFDEVIIATPPAPYLKLARALISDAAAAKAERMPYMGTVCAIAVLDRHFSPHYWINNTRENAPFVVLVEQTRFVPESTYGGKHPLYLARYIDPASDFYRLPDEDIWKQYEEELGRINPDFRRDWIVERYLFRAPFTQPVVTVGYEVPSFSTDCDGLWWVSMSHIYPWDRGTDRSLAAGREVARMIIARSYGS